MASLAQYLDGVVLVPLHLLFSEGFSECPDTLAALAEVWDFERFLNNVTKPITGVVCPNTTMEMCEKMGVTLTAFRRTLLPHERPCTNLSVKINCLVGDGFLDKARRVLGSDYQCMVRIYSISPELPGLYTDGQICRQLVLQSANVELRSGTDWDGFMKRLTTGKQRHINMIMGHQSIWKAMQPVARFPGLWEDVLIGNFAKNLAAHLDDAVVSFWEHIDSIWTTIFHGLETHIPFLDVESVRYLQYKAPASSEEDREALMALFRQGMLLPKIQDPEHRAILWRNISSIRVIIPSIFTFHQNFSFITIGVKIMENNLICKDKSRNSKGPGRQPLSTLGRLEAQWVSTSPVIEIENRVFRSFAGSPSSKYSFLAVLLFALRHFPFLGRDSPREDVKGEAMAVSPTNDCLFGLCESAHCHGFRGGKIDTWGSFEPFSYSKPYPMSYSKWRGGRPTISVHYELVRTGYVLDMLNAKPLTPAWVLDDMLTAFFGDILHRYGEAGARPDNSTANEDSRPVATADHTVVPTSYPQQIPRTTANPDIEVSAVTGGGLESNVGNYTVLTDRPESVRSVMAPPESFGGPMSFPIQENPVQDRTNVTPHGIPDGDIELPDRLDSVRSALGNPLKSNAPGKAKTSLKPNALGKINKSKKPATDKPSHSSTVAVERLALNKGPSPLPPAGNTRASHIRPIEEAVALADFQPVLSSNNPNSDPVTLVPGESVHQHAPENSRVPPGDIHPSASAALPDEAHTLDIPNRSDSVRSTIHVLEPQLVGTLDSVLPNESVPNQSSTTPIGPNVPLTGPESEAQGESMMLKSKGLELNVSEGENMESRSMRVTRSKNQARTDRVLTPLDTATEQQVPNEERSGNINSSRIASSHRNAPQATRYPVQPSLPSHPNAPNQHYDEMALFTPEDGPRDDIDWDMNIE